MRPASVEPDLRKFAVSRARGNATDDRPTNVSNGKSRVIPTVRGRTPRAKYCGSLAEARSRDVNSTGWASVTLFANSDTSKPPKRAPARTLRFLSTGRPGIVRSVRPLRGSWPGSVRRLGGQVLKVRPHVGGSAAPRFERILRRGDESPRCRRQPVPGADDGGEASSAPVAPQLLPL